MNAEARNEPTNLTGPGVVKPGFTVVPTTDLRSKRSAEGRCSQIPLSHLALVWWLTLLSVPSGCPSLWCVVSVALWAGIFRLVVSDKGE